MNTHKQLIFFSSTLSLILIFLSGCSTHVRSSRQSRKETTKQEEYLPSKGIKQTTLQEAIACKKYYLKHQRDLGLAIKYLEHAVMIVKDHTLRSELMLELADTYLEFDEREKAYKAYGAFKTLYPGSSKIKYVHYQEIVANNADSLESTKDQTKTKNAVKLGEQFLQEFPDDTEYSEHVKKIIQQSYAKLFKNELETAQFYLNKFTYNPNEASLKAAHKRIEHLLKEYGPHLNESEQLLHVDDNVITTSLDAYYKSLQVVVAQLEKYLSEKNLDNKQAINKAIPHKRSRHLKKKRNK